MSLFTDEFRTPAAAAWTAEMLWLLNEWPEPLSGIYHLSGGGRLSRFEIGRLLMKRWGLSEALLQAGSLRDYQGPPRSPDTSLNCGKLERLLGIRFPGLGEWLEENPAEPF
jgi:dTDP-4-dehydrorhamnose reductase